VRAGRNSVVVMPSNALFARDLGRAWYSDSARGDAVPQLGLAHQAVLFAPIAIRWDAQKRLEEVRSSRQTTQNEAEERNGAAD
jgi:hypothetical protein